VRNSGCLRRLRRGAQSDFRPPSCGDLEKLHRPRQV